MNIQLSNPSLVPDLIEFLRRAAGIALETESRGAMVRVDAPAAIEPTRARRHLVLYVAAWQGLHPGVRIDIDDV